MYDKYTVNERRKELSKIEQAKKLISHGYNLLPLNNKIPTIKFNGVNTNNATLAHLKSGGTDFALRLDGLLLLDIDTSVNHDIDENKALRMLAYVRGKGWFDENLDSFERTSSGGFHIIYRLHQRNKYVVPKHNTSIIDGVDIKYGPNSYFRYYGWSREPREIPSQMYAWLTRQGVFKTESSVIKYSLTGMPESEEELIEDALRMIRNLKTERNNSLYGKLRELTVDYEIDLTPYKSQILQAALACGLKEGEIKATYRSATQ